MKIPGRKDPGPLRHLERHREILGILAEEGLHVVIDAFSLRRFGRVPKPPSVSRDAQPVDVEERIRRTLERLGPMFVKAGQAISTRTDVISPQLAASLRKLQDEVSPESFETIRKVIETEFDAPLSEVFLEFDEIPTAGASIGQVHFATLHDGTEVAVKIQRPGVRAKVAVDIDIVLTQVKWLASHTDVFRDIDAVAIAEEFAAAILEELDYIKEASNAELLWRAFRDDDTVFFPRVHWARTSSKVLTLDRVVGIRMNRVDLLDAEGVDRALLAERGIRCYLSQMLEIGHFHADAHPGNYFALPDGRVGFTDFGRLGRVTEESRYRFIDLVWAAVNKDHRLATDTLMAVGMNPAVDEVALGREVARLINKYHGMELGRMNFSELSSETLGLIRNYSLGVPSDFAMMLGTFVVLEGVGRMLDPAFDFATVATPHVERVVRERSSVEALTARGVKAFAHALRVLEQLPDSTDRMLRRLSQGEIKVSVRATDYENLVVRIQESVNRLAFAIVVAALIIGFSSLLRATGVPGWVQFVGQVGLVAAFGVSMWFFGSIILATFRQRDAKSRISR